MTLADGVVQHLGATKDAEGQCVLELDDRLSRALFARTGQVVRLDAHVPAGAPLEIANDR